MPDAIKIIQLFNNVQMYDSIKIGAAKAARKNKIE